MTFLPASRCFCIPPDACRSRLGLLPLSVGLPRNRCWYLPNSSYRVPEPTSRSLREFRDPMRCCGKHLVDLSVSSTPWLMRNCREPSNVGAESTSHLENARGNLALSDFGGPHTAVAVAPTSTLENAGSRIRANQVETVLGGDPDFGGEVRTVTLLFAVSSMTERTRELASLEFMLARPAECWSLKCIRIGLIFPANCGDASAPASAPF